MGLIPLTHLIWGGILQISNNCLWVVNVLVTNKEAHMVSIQGDEFVSELNVTASTPKLRLVDFSTGPAVSKARAGRRKEKKLESRLFSLTLAAVVLFFVISGATSILNLGSSLASASQIGGHPTQTIVVKPGDTLWQIASRYGDPNVYILDRVEAITRLNHMADGQALVSGQEIRVPILK